ncbi:MAG: nucleotidyltransferase family protein [Tepidisphaerales bacterium]
MVALIQSLAALRHRRAEILAAAHSRGALNVRIIGSVARGEADEASDVDFLVDFEPGRTVLDHAGLIVDLQGLLGVKVDVADSDGLRSRVRERVLREAQPL